MLKRFLRFLLPTISMSVIVTAGSVTVSAQSPFAGDIGRTFGPVTDSCAFSFALFDATAGGTQIGPMIERTLRVHGGLYETELDFGPEGIEGGIRFLEVAVGCPSGTAELTTLTRRLYNPDPGLSRDSQSDGRSVPHGASAPPKAALGTAFTYQGELQESGAPVTGAGDFQFSLWDALQGGSQIGATVPVNGVAVADGRFTASLDFGAAAFDGDARWLEIAVDYPSGAGSPTTLSPRQPLSAAPYALQTRGIYVDDTGNVGVGTDIPAGPFHVVGSTTMEGGLHIDSGQGIQFPDLSNRIYQDLGRLQLESSDSIRISPINDLRVAGSTLVVNNTTDRVGIGTNAPGYPFHVIGSTMIEGDLHIDTDHDIQFPDTSNKITAIDGDLHLQSDEDIVIQASNLFAVDYLTLTVNSTTNRVGIGTTSPDESLQVENQLASGRAFLKLQTSHPSDWGETGIRFETPQNRWHLRMDDDANNNLPEGALGLRCNTPAHEIMTWTEDGTVGVGTTQPTAKLDVVGDLKVSGNFTYSSEKTVFFNASASMFEQVDFVDENDTYGKVGDYGFILNGSSPYDIRIALPVHLPNDAVLNNVRLYYTDNEATADLDLSFRLSRRYHSNLSGGSLSTGSISTSGASSGVLSADFDIDPEVTIDNENYQHVLYIDLTQDALLGLLRFYGVRLTYEISTVDF